MAQNQSADIRIAVRVVLIVLPLFAFFFGISDVFKPRDLGEYLFVAHWLLLPFVPIYSIWCFVIVWVTLGRTDIVTHRSAARQPTVAQSAQTSAQDVKANNSGALAQFRGLADDPADGAKEGINLALLRAELELRTGKAIEAVCPICKDRLSAGREEGSNGVVLSCPCRACFRQSAVR